MRVYDVLGNEVATLVNEEKSIGVYEVIFDASQLTSGIYFYKLQTASFVETRKMILLKWVPSEAWAILIEWIAKLFGKNLICDKTLSERILLTKVMLRGAG